MNATILEVLKDFAKFLTFRATAEDYARFGRWHFVVGLLVTWLVGVARNWDYPSAPLFARLGLPSVVYIFLLSFILFAMAWPPSPRRAGYFKVLTIVSMTAPPGLIYGIPVERMMTVGDAMMMNALFLTIVALWRVGLVLHFFTVGCGNSFGVSFAIVFLPIQLIAIALVATGRAGYVMDIMGGMRERTPDAQDVVNTFIAAMSCWAIPLSIVALLVYGLATGGKSRQSPPDDPP